MRHPQHLARSEQRRADHREDLVRTLDLLRRALAQRGRADVETFCRGFLRQVGEAELPADDRAEMAAVVELLLDRVKYGLSERLRKLLLPLAAAVESQMELSE
jgi:hypothetical protein